MGQPSPLPQNIPGASRAHREPAGGRGGGSIPIPMRPRHALLDVLLIGAAAAGVWHFWLLVSAVRGE